MTNERGTSFVGCELPGNDIADRGGLLTEAEVVSLGASPSGSGFPTALQLGNPWLKARHERCATAASCGQAVALDHPLSSCWFWHDWLRVHTPSVLDVSPAKKQEAAAVTFFEKVDGNVESLKEEMFVTLWVECEAGDLSAACGTGDGDGGRRTLCGALPFKGVIYFDPAVEMSVSGFSLWLRGKEIYWQRLFNGIGARIKPGDNLVIDMVGLDLESMPFDLS